MTKEQFFNAVKYLRLDYHVNQDIRIEFSAKTELRNTLDECPELETELIMLEIARNPDLLDRVKKCASIHWADGLSDSLYMAVLHHVNKERDKNGQIIPKTASEKDKNEPVKGECTQDSSNPDNFSLQAQAQPVYLTGKDYITIKVRHWKQEYILPEIDNPVAVGLYALFRAYHAEKGNYPLNIQTRYIYRRQDTGEIITAVNRKQLNIRTERISYGLRELYRRSGGGSSDYQLIKALEQLTATGYLTHDGAGGYMASDKQPERLLNADEFLSFAEQSGISVAIYGYGCIRLDGDNEIAKKQLQRMLDYS